MIEDNSDIIFISLGRHKNDDIFMDITDYDSVKKGFEELKRIAETGGRT